MMSVASSQLMRKRERREKHPAKRQASLQWKKTCRDELVGCKMALLFTAALLLLRDWQLLLAADRVDVVDIIASYLNQHWRTVSLSKKLCKLIAI